MALSRRAFAALGVSALFAEDAAADDDLAREAYPLDGFDREVPRAGKLVCPQVDMVRHRGTHLRYDATAMVHEAFRDRLVAFEKLTRAHCIARYGRAPRQAVQLGTFNCRRIGGYPNLMSEHGLGNALDLAGFDFPALAKGEKLPLGVPAALRNAFAVRIDRHWSAKDPVGAAHAEFLRTLAHKIIAARDVFRVVLGPNYPGHKNHLHLDCAPYRLVDVFGEDA
jgi:hypothetical protein